MKAILLAGGRSINILVDCGMAQGHDPQVPFDRFPMPPAVIDFLFLTHAHIDHIGQLPDLIDAGFCGEIICTHGTKALLLPMLKDAMSFSGPPDACDLLILESTYGYQNHGNRADRLETLAKTLDHALSDSGIVQIPAFALSRTQELIDELDRINPGVPVFIDSPLGIRITRLYQEMDDCWDREAKALKAAGDHPIRFNHLYAAEKFQDHQRLLHLKGPAVIIAGSGMCTGGRIVNHLKHGLDDPKNDVFFVGFQAKGTPGRDIVEGRTPSKAAFHRLSGYSAHADQQSLCDWVKSMPEPHGEIRLVHGELEAQKALKSKLDILFRK